MQPLKPSLKILTSEPKGQDANTNLFHFWQMPIMPSQTASVREPEHALAYFREDIGLNLHHWHWHLVYPSSGETNVVKKDRRGELFYYMHLQMLAR